MILKGFILLYLVLLITILIYSAKQFRLFFSDTVVGFNHFRNGFKIIVISHIIIGIVCILFSSFYLYKFFGQSINLKLFINSLYLSIGITIFIYICLTFVYYYLNYRLNKEGLLEFYDFNEDITESHLENMKNILKANYFAIVRNMTSYIMFLQLIFCLFPTPEVDEYKFKIQNRKPVGIYDIVGQAKLKYGNDYIKKLYEMKQKYIKRFGAKKFYKIFGAQFASIDRELDLYEAKLNEMENYKKEVKKERDKIIFDEYYKFRQTADTK